MKRFIYILLGVVLLSGCRNVTGDDSERTAERDSLYSVSHIRDIAITEPERALALLDTADMRGLLSPFDISDLRCGVYHNGLSDYRMALYHGLKAYDDSDSRKDPPRFLSLLETLSNASHYSGDYAGSVRYCAEGMKLARETGNVRYEANFHASYGMNLWEMEQREETFRQLDTAIGLLGGEAEKSDSYAPWDDLVYVLGKKVSLLCDEERYAEADGLLPALENAVRGVERAADVPDGLADMRRSMFYVVASCIAYQQGDTRKGDRCYRLLEETRYASTPDGEALRIPCLLLARRFGEALHYLKREKAYWQAHTDTVSYDYIDGHLAMEHDAYEGLGDWRSAEKVYGRMLALTDSLRIRERQRDALELAEIYKSGEKDRQIRKSREEKRLLTVFALVVAVALGASVYYNHKIRRRNVALVRAIKENLAGKDELLRKEEECHRHKAYIETLERQVTELERANEDLSSSLTVFKEQDGQEDDGLLEKVLFEIADRKLYCRTGITAKTLQEELGLPANIFGARFEEKTGQKFTEYINGLRMNLAARLLIEYPDYTIDAVGKMCGIDSRQHFHRLFSDFFHITPSAFRKGNKDAGNK